VAAAPDEERLVWLGALKCARAPHGREEVGDRLANPHPQRLVVGLEDGPLRPLVYRLLHEQEEPSDVDVLQERIARHGAGAPDANAAPLRTGVADDVHAPSVQNLAFLTGHAVLERLERT